MANFPLPIAPFPVPNEVVLVVPPAKREAGYRPSPTLALDQLSVEVLTELCRDFTRSVFEVAGKKPPL